MPIASPRRRTARGFTLLEMSIVLAIIGLIIGGIIGGQELYRASQLQSILTDINKFQTAFGEFKLKYSQLPGDLTDATRYWGQSSNCASTANACTNIDNCNAQATCNGNGDGNIGNNPDGSRGAGWGETFWVWQHLSNAKMVRGTYSGLPGPGAIGVWDFRIGVNSPASRISSVGYSLFYMGKFSDLNPTYQPAWYPGTYGNLLAVGKENPGYETTKAAFTPGETWSMDKKIDDGMPGKGRIIVNTGNATTCANGDNTTGATATYNLSLKNVLCAFYYTRIAE